MEEVKNIKESEITSLKKRSSEGIVLDDVATPHNTSSANKRTKSTEPEHQSPEGRLKLRSLESMTERGYCIFDNPFSEFLSKLADCLDFLRMRFFVDDNQTISNLVLCYQIITDSEIPSPIENPHAYLEKDIDFLQLVESMRQYPAVIFLNQKDYSDILPDNMGVGDFFNFTSVPNTFIVKPPPGFCFSEDLLVMVNSDMVNLLYDCSLNEKCGDTPFEIETGDDQPEDCHDTLDQVKATFNIFMDSWVGLYMFFISNTLTRNFVMRHLLVNLENSALIKAYACARLEKYMGYRTRRCIEVSGLALPIPVGDEYGAPFHSLYTYFFDMPPANFDRPFYANLHQCEMESEDYESEGFRMLFSLNISSDPASSNILESSLFPSGSPTYNFSKAILETHPALVMSMETPLTVPPLNLGSNHSSSRPSISHREVSITRNTLAFYGLKQQA